MASLPGLVALTFWAWPFDYDQIIILDALFGLWFCIGSRFVPHDREFPLVLAFQSILGREHGKTCSVLLLLQADIGVLSSGLKKAERLTKGKKGIKAMRHSSEASSSQTLLRRQGAFTWAGLVHISFQQVQDSQSFGEGCSQHLMLRCICQSSGNLLR